MTEKTSTQWNCPNCDNLLYIRQNTNYFSCHLCGSAFKLRWRSGQIIDHIALRNIKNILSSSFSSEEVEEGLEAKKSELQQLNASIRRIEMSKSGERLKVLSLFVMVCAVIYGLFRFSVDGIRSLDQISMVDMYAGAGAALAFLIFTAYGIYKSAMVKKVNTLLSRRKGLEMEVHKDEASLHVYDQQVKEAASDPKSIPQEKTSVTAKENEELAQQAGKTEKDIKDDNQEDPGDNIIKNFAARKRGRRPLSLRDEE